MAIGPPDRLAPRTLNSHPVVRLPRRTTGCFLGPLQTLDGFHPVKFPLHRSRRGPAGHPTLRFNKPSPDPLIPVPAPPSPASRRRPVAPRFVPRHRPNQRQPQDRGWSGSPPTSGRVSFSQSDRHSSITHSGIRTPDMSPVRTAGTGVTGPGLLRGRMKGGNFRPGAREKSHK